MEVLNSALGTYLTGTVSFALLVVASWCVGEGGEILGQKYDASIIGGLVIAWLNTAPEAIFFITALNGNNPNFAVGAVSGSTIVVCTVALGACLYIGSTVRKSKPFNLQISVKKQCFILAGSVIVPVSISIIGFSIVLGLFGIIFYCGFLYYSLTSAPASSSKKDDLDLELGVDEEEEEEHESVTKGVLFLLAGGILIVLFSSPFITSVVELATIWHVSPTLLAFFFAPIASEAPEILESISLSRKGNLQNINIAFSNLVGGTITKTTLLCGIFCIYGVTKEFLWDSPSYTISMLLLSVCSLTAAIIGGFTNKLSAKHGVILFVTFAIAGIVQYYYNTGVGLASFELIEEATVRINNFGAQGISQK